jgi:hypothetical protein
LVEFGYFSEAVEEQALGDSSSITIKSKLSLFPSFLWAPCLEKSSAGGKGLSNEVSVRTREGERVTIQPTLPHPGASDTDCRYKPPVFLGKE